MELKQLESYVMVVEKKSFTAAAQALYISQPTISTHIRALEKELESRLILRTTKSIEVTPRGAELYECAVGMLRMRDHLLERWNGDSKKIIRLGASTIPSAYILPEFLPSFCKEHKDVFFHSTQSDSKGVIDGVMEDLFDVGLIGMACEEDSLACVPFYEDEMVIITPVNEHFFTLKKENVSVRDLFREPVILREQGSGTKKAADLFLEQEGILKKELQVVAYMNDPEAIKNSVAAGLGISVISKKAAQNLIEENRLLSFEVPVHSSGRNFYIIYKKDYIQKPFIRLFIDYIRNYYKN
ncbi:MAG: selenium metabolism-associated LysR family transcriptional regulator [Lachnospiraceae bacterium]